MDYRPHPLILGLFGLLLVLNAASVCLYSVTLALGNSSWFQAFYLAMSVFAILVIVAFAVCYTMTHRRPKPIKAPYILVFALVGLANLAVSITVSIRASAGVCYQSSEGCHWGGIALIFPWITTIFSAGGLIVTIAERHLIPIEVLTKAARKKVDRVSREWLEGCFDQCLKLRAGNSLSSAVSMEPFNPYLDPHNIIYPDPIPIVIHPPSPDNPPRPETPEPDTWYEESTCSFSPESTLEDLTNETDIGLASTSVQFPSDTESTLEDMQTSDVAEGVVEEQFYVRPRRKRPLPRPRLAESGATRPQKLFVIRFQEPVAVPDREYPRSDSSSSTVVSFS